MIIKIIRKLPYLFNLDYQISTTIKCNTYIDYDKLEHKPYPFDMPTREVVDKLNKYIINAPWNYETIQLKRNIEEKYNIEIEISETPEQIEALGIFNSAVDEMDLALIDMGELEEDDLIHKYCKEHFYKNANIYKG